MIVPVPERRAWLLAACLFVLRAAPGWGCTTDLECASLFLRCRGPGLCSNGDCAYPNPLNCNDSNPCTVDGCDDLRGGCFHDPYCPADTSVCNGTETCAVVIISLDPPRRGPRCGRSDVPTCDDQKACTIDFCREPNGCGHTAVNCDDGDLCTVDACAEPAGCSHTPRDCDDGDACTADDCLPGSGCRHVPITPCCESAADCPDVVCAVERQCVANGCTAGVPRACDDGDAATVDSCDAGQGGCVHVRLPDDGGPGSCVDAGDCAADADPCTTAACSAGRCVQTSLDGLAGLTCTCARPAPDACRGQEPPAEVARAGRRACRIVGRVADASGPRRGKLLRRVAKQFGRAERAALGATTRRNTTVTASCAAALRAVYADGVTRARQLEERK